MSRDNEQFTDKVLLDARYKFNQALADLNKSTSSWQYQLTHFLNSDNNQAVATLERTITPELKASFQAGEKLSRQHRLLTDKTLSVKERENLSVYTTVQSELSQADLGSNAKTKTFRQTVQTELERGATKTNGDPNKDSNGDSQKTSPTKHNTTSTRTLVAESNNSSSNVPERKAETSANSTTHAEAETAKGMFRSQALSRAAGQDQAHTEVTATPTRVAGAAISNEIVHGQRNVNSVSSANHESAVRKPDKQITERSETLASISSGAHELPTPSGLLCAKGGRIDPSHSLLESVPQKLNDARVLAEQCTKITSATRVNFAQWESTQCIGRSPSCEQVQPQRSVTKERVFGPSPDSSQLAVLKNVFPGSLEIRGRQSAPHTTDSLANEIRSTENNPSKPRANELGAILIEKTATTATLESARNLTNIPQQRVQPSAVISDISTVSPTCKQSEIPSLGAQPIALKFSAYSKATDLVHNFTDHGIATQWRNFVSTSLLSAAIQRTFISAPTNFSPVIRLERSLKQTISSRETAVDPFDRAVAGLPNKDLSSKVQSRISEFKCSRRVEKRYITGAEVALAMVLAAGGLSKARNEEGDKCDPSNAQKPKGQLDAQEIKSDKLEQSEITVSAAEHLPMQREQVTGEQDQIQLRKRPTIMISLNDTLASIAINYFNDENLSLLIADLNVDRCQETHLGSKRIVKFKNRQEILLPIWQDIQQFYRSGGSSMKAIDLVTIVETTEVDRELLSIQLKTIISRSNPI